VWVYCIWVGILYFMGISYLCKYFVMCGYMVFVYVYCTYVGIFVLV
jgi:hypothetical protein